MNAKPRLLTFFFLLVCSVLPVAAQYNTTVIYHTYKNTTQRTQSVRTEFRYFSAYQNDPERPWRWSEWAVESGNPVILAPGGEMQYEERWGDLPAKPDTGERVSDGTYINQKYMEERVSATIVNAGPSAALQGDEEVEIGKTGSWSFTAADDFKLASWRFYNANNPSAGWSPVSGTFAGGAHSQKITSDQTFYLEVVDSDGATASAEFTVKAKAPPPPFNVPVGVDAFISGDSDLLVGQEGSWNFGVNGAPTQWRFRSSTNPGAGWSPASGGSVSGSHRQAFGSAGVYYWVVEATNGGVSDSDSIEVRVRAGPTTTTTTDTTPDVTPDPDPTPDPIPDPDPTPQPEPTPDPDPEPEPVGSATISIASLDGRNRSRTRMDVPYETSYSTSGSGHFYFVRSSSPMAVGSTVPGGAASHGVSAGSGDRSRLTPLTSGNEAVGIAWGPYPSSTPTLIAVASIEVVPLASVVINNLPAQITTTKGLGAVNVELTNLYPFAHTRVKLTDVTTGRVWRSAPRIGSGNGTIIFSLSDALTGFKRTDNTVRVEIVSQNPVAAWREAIANGLNDAEGSELLQPAVTVELDVLDRESIHLNTL